MKLALDPFMHRSLPIREVVRLAADLGYEHLEWSWREDFIPLFRWPRADPDRINELRTALRETGVRLASLVALYRWSSTDPSERTDAVRAWRRVIDIARELEVDRINTEFSGSPDDPERCEAAWQRSIEEVLPMAERAGISIAIEPHPGDFVEDGLVATDIVRAVGSDHLKYLYCAPHTFHMRHDPATMIRYAASVLAHVHVADTLDHRASSGLRFIVNPLGAPVRVHQHLNLGEGEVDWDTFFATLNEIRFDGVITSAVFSREDDAVASSRFMRGAILEHIERRAAGT
jgi:myo-inositol catabolism protein IolH